MNKLNKSIAAALFPIVLTTSPISIFGGSFLTEKLADFGGKLIERIIKIDEPELETIEVIATAYSSTPDQTNEDPFITAANTSVRDGIIAANFLPFYTEVMIPELYGEKIFTVEDRMNRRFTNANPSRIDIWMPTRKDAKYFGVKKLEIVILPKEEKEG